jgi:hypothetical protein
VISLIRPPLRPTFYAQIIVNAYATPLNSGSSPMSTGELSQRMPGRSKSIYSGKTKACKNISFLLIRDSEKIADNKKARMRKQKAEQTSLCCDRL